MSRLVGQLEDEIEHNRAMIKFCLERREDRFCLQVLKEIKKYEFGFKKQVEELEEHVYLCLVTINRARDVRSCGVQLRIQSRGFKSTDQIQDFDAPLQINKSHLEGENLREVSEINLSRLSNTGLDDLEDQRTSTSSALDNNPLYERTDLYSTPETNRQRTNLFQSSSVVEVSQSNDINFSPSPQVRRAPVHRNLFLESQEIAFSRSMTERRGSPMPALKLDRLSEREKKNLIVNLMKIQNDGTVEVDLTKDSPVASELLEFHPDYPVERIPSTVDYITTDYNKSIPKLKIAVLVVGTRGDVQPFLAVARRLQKAYFRKDTTIWEAFLKMLFKGCEYGHRVRLATHSNFRGFVKSAGVEFYPLGGDPRVLAGYMARNKGLIPSAPGEISIQRKQIKAIIETLLPACTEPDPITGEPFRAQAIIANPPAYGHAHVAEALGVPLHIFFTMPWTPTYAFPHPLARVPQSAGYWPLEDSHKTTDIILEALKNTGQRGIIDRGWGELGTHSDIPDNVFHLVDCPHDWLFPQCSAVVHHGGAGTTATGLKAGFFWGERIYQKGLGPAPIPISQLSIESLSEAIKFMLQPEVDIGFSQVEASVAILRMHTKRRRCWSRSRCVPPPFAARASIPTPPSSEKDDGPNPVQWLFIQIGRLCSLPCGS
ncbi:hypothetical protein DH2020_034811 [Rehmannia glutinosa]|uniref:Glycosyltransferase family 28 N-terminal domain-containing protein n=1 Tax=Rehmannia glutinosa TaxID=99300 RepID=A0ABR0VAI4_REHGL